LGLENNGSFLGQSPSLTGRRAELQFHVILWVIADSGVLGVDYLLTIDTVRTRLYVPDFTVLHVGNSINLVHFFLYIRLTIRDSVAMNIVDERRGTKIRFVGGKYIGEVGWFDTSREATAKSYPVIINAIKKKDGKIGDVTAMVRKTSVGVQDEPDAESYVGAVFQQHPKITQLMDKLCAKLAMCEIDPQNGLLYKIFKEKYVEAVERQTAKGSDATWYQIEYVGDDS
jgi:hypothetical protein